MPKLQLQKSKVVVPKSGVLCDKDRVKNKLAENEEKYLWGPCHFGIRREGFAELRDEKENAK